MIFHDVQQNSEEWFDLRLGKATSSNFGKVMANYGKAFGKPAQEYALKIVLEGLSGERVTESFSNGWMEQGHELEPLARDAYEEATFNVVSNGGFCEHSNLPIGCSPDGLVSVSHVFGANGGIEIKCPKFTTHYANIKRDSFDPTYKWQLIGNMWICELDWIDFVSFCQEFPKGKQLYIHRLDRADYTKEILELNARVREFLKEIEAIKTTMI